MVALETEVATRSVKRASRSSVSGSNLSFFLEAMLTAPQTVPSTTIGTPTAAVRPGLTRHLE